MEVHRDVLASYLKMVKLISLWSSEEGSKKGQKHGVFQVVRAVELIFAPHFLLATGRFSWISMEKHGLPVCQTTRHAWLTLPGNDELLLDVLPQHQPSNMKVPMFISLASHPRDTKGYFPEKIRTPPDMLLGVTRDTEELADVLIAMMNRSDF